MINKLMKWFGLKDKEVDITPTTFILKQDYPKCYKYCVDTHKYYVVGNVVDGNIVFNKAYPLRDNWIARTYQYVFFINVDGNFKTFIPKNVPQQVSSNTGTNYVLGYMKDNEVVYYDQCSRGE